MAILQVGTPITATNANAASTTLTSASYSVANNEVAIIAIQLPDTGTVSSITDSAGRSWSFINAANHSNSSCRTEFWRYVNTSGSTKTGTTTVNTASVKKTLVIGVYSGANTSDPIGTHGTTGGAQTNSPTVSINMNAANSWMFGSYATDGVPTFTADGSDTLVGENVTSGQGGSTNVRGVLVRDNTVNATAGSTLTTTGQWSSTFYWVAAGVELKEATVTTSTAQSTTGVISTLEQPQKFTVAVFTDLQTNATIVKSTTAVLTTLEKPLKSTVGVFTPLETPVTTIVKSTTAVSAALETAASAVYSIEYFNNLKVSSLPSGWSQVGTATWTYSISTGIAFTSAPGDPEKLLYTSGTGTQDREVQALVKMDNIADTGTENRAGIAILSDSAGDAINLVLRGNNSLSFLDDGSAWGTSTPIAPVQGESWWFKARYNAEEKTFYGKAWKDGTAEPGWMITWAWGANAVQTYSGLNGNSNTQVNRVSFTNFSISYPNHGTIGVVAELEANKRSTTAVFTNLENGTTTDKNTAAALTILEKSLQTSTTALLTTLEKSLQRSTTALSATLEKAPKNTTAILTTLERAGDKTTLAIFTTLEKSVQKSTTAVLATIEKAAQPSTISVSTTLEKGQGSTSAVFTDLVGNKLSTTAVLSTLEGTPLSSAAVLTSLEKPIASTVAVSASLEGSGFVSTVGVYAPLEKKTANNVAVLTTLEKAGQSSTVGISTTLETYLGYNKGNAVFFNGSSGKIGLTNSSTYKHTAELTVSFWMRTRSSTAPSTYYPPVNNGAYQTDGYQILLVNNSGTQRFHIRLNNSAATATTSSAIVDTADAVDTTQLHHYVWTFSNGTSKLYIDGILKKTVSHSAEYASIVYNVNRAMELGYDGSRWLNGWMDDFRMYGRVLSDTEVGDLYNNQIVDATSLSIHLPFNENSGTTASDISGNSNNGTLVGGTTWSSGLVAVDRPLAVLTTLEHPGTRITAAIMTTLESAAGYGTAAVVATLERSSSSTTAVFTDLVGTRQSTAGVLTILEQTQRFSTVPVTAQLERTAQGTVGIVTTLEESPDVATVGLFTLLEKSAQTSITALLTTLAKPETVTTAVLTMLEHTGVKQTVAVSATLERSGNTSTAPIFTTLDKLNNFSTVAIQSTLEKTTRATVGISTLLEDNTPSTMALLTELEGSGTAGTVAVQTVLEKKTVHAVAVITTLEAVPQYRTLAVHSALERVATNTVAILTTLEKVARTSTTALTTQLEGQPRSTAAVYTTLEKPGSPTMAVLSTLEKAGKQTTSILTTLEVPARQSTTAVFTDLVSRRESTTAVFTHLENIGSRHTVAVATELEGEPKSTVAIFTDLQVLNTKGTVPISTTLEATAPKVFMNYSMAAAPPSSLLKGQAFHIPSNGGSLRLNPNTDNSYGAIEASSSLSSFVSSATIFAMNGPGDSMFFYWGGASSPIVKTSVFGGYLVAFSEVENKVMLYFNGTLLASATQNFLNTGVS